MADGRQNCSPESEKSHLARSIASTTCLKSFDEGKYKRRNRGESFATADPDPLLQVQKLAGSGGVAKKKKPTFYWFAWDSSTLGRVYRSRKRPNTSRKKKVNSCLEVINSLHIRDKAVYQKWDVRMKAVARDWEAQRESLFVSSLDCYSELKGPCHRCGSGDVVVRCSDCTRYKYLCHNCDSNLHDEEDFFQHLVSLNVNFSTIFLIFKGRTIHLSSCQECHSSGSSDISEGIGAESCVVVNCKGRYDLYKYKIRCCDCYTEFDPFNVDRLAKSGYWPGNVSTINNHLFSLAFKEWKYCQYEIDKLMGKDWMKCPCCSISQHSCHVDGNCKLYRYKSAGVRRNKSYYAGQFIYENEVVDEFVQKVYKDRGSTASSVSWDGEWQEGAARSTGEETE
eukprot:gene4264-4831_t